MNYKKSKYNIVIDYIEEGVLVFNSFTTSLLWIPNEYWQYDFYNEYVTSEWEQLIDSGIWIEENRDELCELSSYLKNSVKQVRQDLSITIVPTYLCNMKCQYCFQSDNNEALMSYEMADRIYSEILPIISKYKSINIFWFGGEPLLGLKIIEYLSEKLISFCDKNNIVYTANMTTNGTLLTQEVSKKLASLKISQVQVTLDGTDHDSTRVMKNGSSSYKIIIENISHAVDFLNIVIRSNVTEENIKSIKDMIDELMGEYGLKDKIRFSLYPVSEFEGKNAKDCSFRKYCKLEAFSSGFVEIIHHMMQYTDADHIANLNLASSSIPCEAILKDVIAVDAYGDVYKCSLSMQNQSLKIGNLKENDLKEILNSGDQNGWLSFTWSDDCMDCNILPMCHSGCFFRRRSSGKSKICELSKYTYRQIAKIIYEVSEREG